MADTAYDADYLREAIAAKVGGAASALAIRAPQSVQLDHNAIGEGAILCPFSTVTTNTAIGRYFLANIHASVAHDCVIGDFVTFAAGVRCNGHVHIHDYATIGANATIKEGARDHPLRIGAGATVGMGAVVTRDVPDGVTVVGNPARPLQG